ncbi:MAG TPA: glycine cleavage T C-terminal barrel domain-containing protein [Candidatus Omnitrophota bacterium]|nr:glycine cleavage T C-terminal barrel domain-containing protein [Candidatus Omnitrophota bacterium]
MSADREVIVFSLPFSVLSVSGQDHISFLHSILSQDIAGMQTGEWRETALLSATSHVMALMTAIKTENSILLLSGAGQAELISKKLARFIITEDVQTQDITTEWQLLEVWGPQRESFLKQLSPAAQIGRQKHLKCTRSLLPAAEKIPAETVLSSESTREMLRIENGMLAYGKDINEKIMLSETRLEKIAASETKGCYPGQEVVAKIETYQRLNRCFVKLIWDSASDKINLPAEGSVILDIENGAEIGCLTSRTYSPFLKKIIGLGWLKRGFFEKPIKVTVKSETNITAETSALA